MWDAIFARIAKDYPDVQTDRMLVDAATMRMVLKPASLDVMVATNLHADILSDLAAALSGQPQPRAQIPIHVRADSRLRPRYCRAGHRQSDWHFLDSCDDASTPKRVQRRRSPHGRHRTCDQFTRIYAGFGRSRYHCKSDGSVVPGHRGVAGPRLMTSISLVRAIPSVLPKWLPAVRVSLKIHLA